MRNITERKRYMNKFNYKRIGNLLFKVKMLIIVKLKTLFNKFYRLFVKAKCPVNANGKTLLHLGCGNINLDKFINIDAFPHKHVHYVQSIDRLPAFTDHSVDFIYACHCLEHFRYNQTESVLGEWFRVLKNEGVLRLSVPDLDKLVSIYQKNNNDPDVILPPLMGGQNNKYNYHFTAFNVVNLTKYLKNVGFVTVHEWEPDGDQHEIIDDFSIYKKEINGAFYEVSLNLEAVK